MTTPQRMASVGRPLSAGTLGFRAAEVLSIRSAPRVPGATVRPYPSRDGGPDGRGTMTSVNQGKGGAMRRVILLVLGFAAALVLVPTTAVADSTPHTYQLLMEVPNIGVAANGDTISITGEGEFAVHPKSVEAERSRTARRPGRSSPTARGRQPSSSSTSRTAAASSSETRSLTTSAAES